MAIEYFYIPLLIFFARVIDVSLGTLRIMLVAKGFERLAPIMGFFEILVWVLAISKVITNLDSWLSYVAYAGGFAMGNYVGMKLEKKLALGHEMIRVITKKDPSLLIESIRNLGYTATLVDAKGAEGKVGVLYIIINRKALQSVLELIKIHNPQAFYTIEDIRFVNKNIVAWKKF